MIKSMTGFGRASAESPAGRATVELRTVNNRGLDVKLRSRDLDGATEHALLAHVRAALRRGSVSVSVEVKAAHASAFDQEWFVGLASSVESLRRTLKIETPLDMPALASFAALVKDDGEKAGKARIDWGGLEPVVSQALALLEQSRLREGQALAQDLEGRRLRLSQIAQALEGLTRGAAQRAGDRLRARVAVILADSALDPQRVAQELALMADRSDVTEELVRLKTHLQHFATLLQSGEGAGEGVGRRMDFWLQEIGREFNTLASKSQDAEVSALVVDAKAELEKIREQAQNIE